MIGQLSVLAMLGICSFDDIKYRQIHIGCLAGFTAEGILCWIFLWEKPMIGILPVLIPGAMMIMISIVTRGGIGEGDGLLLMTAGIFLGISGIVRILFYAIFLSAGYAVFLSVVRKKGKKYAMPFVPFLLIAFVGDIWLKAYY